MTLDKSFLRIDIFKNAFDVKLKHNLSEYLISTLSNMLGLNYASDQKLQTVEKNIQKYANDLAAKLQNYIGDEVILDDKFDIAMGLFIVALSPSMPNKEEPPSLNANKSAIVDVVANLCYPDGNMSQEEAHGLDMAIGEIIASGESSAILSLIEKEPGMLKALLQKRSSPNSIASTLSEASKSMNRKSFISAEFIQFAGIAAAAALGLAGNFAAAAYINAVAPVAIIPTTIAAVKYGTQIGEAIGSKIAEFDGEFQKHSGKLTEMVKNFVPTFKKPNLGKSNEIEKKNEIDKSNSLLNEVKQEVEAHVSTQHDIENAVEIQKIKSQAKSIGKDAI